jgi:hypothetical protein
MIVALVLSGLAMATGAVLGLLGLFAPTAASRLARLRVDPERPGGQAEFRATFGGVFFGLHAAGLVCLALGGGWAMGAAGVLAAGWAGAGAGRLISILADRGAATGFNRASAAVEFALALAIASPLLLR